MATALQVQTLETLPPIDQDSHWLESTASPKEGRLIRCIVLNKSEALRKYAERMIELLPAIKNSEPAQRPVLRVNANKLD